jgi:hypothetical protein
MANNSVKIAGLKVVHYDKPIYRADKETFAPGKSALQNYPNAPMKYFTLNKSELKSYTVYKKPWMKTWEPQEPLVLIDILHKSTRDALGELIGTESLNIAFPIKGNNVSRVSEEDTRIHDDKVLEAICMLGGLDGYYMKRLEKFHSEIGLCPSGLSKLVLVESEKNKTVVPPVSARNKTRRNFNNNNRYKVNFPNSTRKLPRALFGNNNNNNKAGRLTLENLGG